MTEQKVKLITNLILSYFRAVDYVFQTPKLSKEKKLKRLINPLIKLNKRLAPLHSLKENPYRRWKIKDEVCLSWETFCSFKDKGIDIEESDTYPFISERVYKDDLDLENLDYDKSRYSIDWCENERIPDRRGPRIWKYETEEERRLHKKAKREEEARRGAELEDSSIIHSYPQELYLAWLPTLDEEKIQSRDLLDQILVCYTIKRAMNGDKKAIEKLYRLYEDTVQAIGVKFWQRNKESLSMDEAKSVAKNLLLFIIQGFTPEIIIRDSLGHSEGVTLLPGWVKDFLIYYFSEYLPSKVQKTLTELEMIVENGKKDKFWFAYFKLLAILNPYTPIRDNILWKNSPIRIRRFNNYCFRPGVVKMGPYRNLTLWIFGRKGEIDSLTKSEREDGSIAKDYQPYGKLYQLLKDTYSHKPTSLTTHNKSPSTLDKMLSQEVMKAMEKVLSEYGVSFRDIEIFKGRVLQHRKQVELGKTYHLTTRHIRRICNSCKSKLRSSSEVLDLLRD